jgi:hypothetical protein
MKRQLVNWSVTHSEQKEEAEGLVVNPATLRCEKHGTIEQIFCNIFCFLCALQL